MENKFLFYQITVYAMGLCSLLVMTYILATGQDLRYLRLIGGQHNSGDVKERHQIAVNLLIILTLSTVFMVEVCGRLVFHVITHSWLFWVHLICFAIPFLSITFALRIWIPGDSRYSRRRRIHGALGKAGLFFGLGANVLGDILVHLQHLP